MEIISILIADAQPLTKAGLRFLLNSRDDIRILSEATTKKAILNELSKQFPSLLILDHQFNAILSPAELQELTAIYTELNILVISSDNDKDSIMQILESGIRGFVTKECSEEEIMNAVYATARGEKYFCGKIFDMLMDRHLTERTADAGAALVSERESQVLKLIAEGHTSLRIADMLNLSIHTIHTHRKNIIRKLGIRSPTEFVIHAMELGLIDSRR